MQAQIPQPKFFRVKAQAQNTQPKFLSLKRKCKFRNQNLKSLKRNCKFRNKISKRFKAQTQILQPKIENSTAQLRIDCLRSAHKFRYLKKFLSTNFCIIEVSKARLHMEVQTSCHLQLSCTGINQLHCV